MTRRKGEATSSDLKRKWRRLAGGWGGQAPGRRSQSALQAQRPLPLGKVY